MADTQSREDGSIQFMIEAPLKGVWTHASPLANPPGFASDLTNCNIYGDIIEAQKGNAKFIATAWPSGTINLIADRRIAGQAPVIFIASTSGKLWYWSGAAWVEMRRGLSTTATLWWSKQQYGTDVFVSNPTDGIYRWDGDTLVPIGAKPLAQCEADEAAQWANETADTTNLQEGVQSFYIESVGGAGATMTFTPTTNLDAKTGRLSARQYEVSKSPGTDYYHFKVMFSNTGTVDATNTKVVITDGSAKSLTWPLSAWDSDRSGTAFPTSPVAGTWYDAYLKGADGTEVATFNPADIDTIAFTVDSSDANTLRMNIDDIYVIYAATMPAVKVLAEWKNILFGGYTTANPDAFYWSKVRAPDEWTGTATAPIKAGGDAITAMYPFFHQLTIGTEHHVLTLTGNVIGQTFPAYLFDINEVTDECGIDSHRSIVKAENLLHWWYRTHVFTYNGTGVTHIDYPIDLTLTGIDQSNPETTVGVRYPNTHEIWWTWRRSGQSVNDRVMRWNYRYNAWLPSTRTTPLLGITFSSGDHRLLIADNTNRFIYREEDTTPGYTDFGANVTHTVELTAQGAPDRALDWIEAFVAYLSNTGNVVVSYRIADHLRALLGTSYTTLDTVNQAVAGELGRIRAGFAGKVCQFRITATSVPFQLQFPFVIRAREQGTDRVFP